MLPFSYSPLATERDIRLLDLLPGRGPIRCNIRHVSLSSNNDYEALSYCWGAPTKKIKILVDEAKFYVTRNLHAALLRLRDAKHVRTLWIDAICINQNDTPEKNVQVPLMRDIYGSCKRVVIWLGEQDSRTKSAFEGLEFMASRFDAGKLEKFDYGDWKCIKRGEKLGGRFVRSRQILERPVALGAFMSIFGRPWFRRVWIIQELLLGPDPLVVCGSFQTPWETFEKADMVSNVSLDLNQHVENLRKYRRSWRDPEYTVVDHMLWGWKNSTSDPRDKLYGFMGLISDQGIKIPVQVDYATDVEEVFTKFTLQYLSQTGNLWVLGCCRGVRSTGPSWILNYEYDGSADPLPEATFGWYRAFNAGGGTLRQPVLYSDDRLLGLHGYVFDTITGVSPEPDPSPKDGAEITVTKQLLFDYTRIVNFFRLYLAARQLCKIDDKRLYDSTSEPIREAFFQVLVVSITIERRENLAPDISLLRKVFEDFDRVVVGVAGKNITSRPALFLTYVRTILKMSMDSAGAWVFDTFYWQTDATNRRKFAVTGRGYMGLAPRKTEVGDKVILLKGYRAPVVARVVDGKWKLVGDCYLRGIMGGEAYDEGKVEVLWFD
ncbi:heterokaryon incompatibility protein-domain-containing protein [Hypomontagnella monticulosa]|nr:heterokaryon incompatibility protein-domain-containing protein [Hypomontagnella monticulosa]